MFTEPNSTRKWHVDAIGEITKKYNVEIHIEKDIEKAYKLAKSITDEKDAVICAGSLYLIGALYAVADKE